MRSAGEAIHIRKTRRGKRPVRFTACAPLWRRNAAMVFWASFPTSPGQRRRSGPLPESNARRTLQRKRRKKIANSPSMIAHQPKAATSRSNVDPADARRKLSAASLQKTANSTKENNAIPMACTIVSFCFPLMRLRQNLPSFWTVSGNTTFRCRAITSCSHSSLRLRTTILPDAGATKDSPGDHAI